MFFEKENSVEEVGINGDQRGTRYGRSTWLVRWAVKDSS